MIGFECPACQTKMQAAEEHAGLTIECPTCQFRMTVPGAAAPSAAVTAAPPTPTGVTTPEVAQAAQAAKTPWPREDDDDDRHRPRRNTSGAGVAAGIGIGMILLIVGGVGCLCLVVPGAIGVVAFLATGRHADMPKREKAAVAVAKVEAKDVPKMQPEPQQQPMVIPKPRGAEGIDEARRFVHKASGTTFYYPKDWDILEPKQLLSGTSLGLRKNGGALEVTLFWRATMLGAVDDKTRVHAEMGALRQLYGNQVSGGEAIKVGDQLGYRIHINGPPPGIDAPSMRGVVYLFFIKTAAMEHWTLKIRATAKDADKLQPVDELLYHYRWN